MWYFCFYWLQRRKHTIGLMSPVIVCDRWWGLEGKTSHTQSLSHAAELESDLKHIGSYWLRFTLPSCKVQQESDLLYAAGSKLTPLKEQRWGCRVWCKSMQIHVCLSLWREARKREEKLGQLQLFCSKYSCWNTLITQDHYRMPFALLHSSLTKLSCQHFQSYIKRRVQPKTYRYLQSQMSTCSIICHLYIIDRLGMQPSMQEGREQEWSHHRERDTLRWPHFVWDALQVEIWNSRTGEQVYKKEIKDKVLVFPALVQLGLTSGNEKYILLLRYLKH